MSGDGSLNPKNSNSNEAEDVVMQDMSKGNVIQQAEGIADLGEQMKNSNKNYGSSNGVSTSSRGSPSISRRASPKHAKSRIPLGPIDPVRAGVYDERFKYQLGLIGDNVDDPLMEKYDRSDDKSAVVAEIIGIETLDIQDDEAVKAALLGKIDELTNAIATVTKNMEVVQESNRKLRKDRKKLDEIINKRKDSVDRSDES